MTSVLRTHTLATGQRLQVVHGDLTVEPTDAIVNAANGQLAHGGGVAGAIVRAGGETIQDESDAWVERHGRVPTGGVAVTSGGRLPCLCVLHAVGPIWWDGTRREPELLVEAVRTSLEEAARLGLRSVAMPAISSGIFGFPKDQCAELLVGATLAFFECVPGTSVELVRFTNFDAPTVKEFALAFDRAFGPAPEGP
ncbi:MAG: macro domain-containing protein [Deltaproteobacteria bacterium]|nr:macro domain-containing protein [Deltaproteobacteria bacterium]